MKNKILIACLILIFTIGIVTAAEIDIDSIKAPDSYKVVDDDAIYSKTSDLEINIEDFELDDINDTGDADDVFYKNNTELNYTVVPGEINNTFNFTDEINNMYGCVELVEIDGRNYTVYVWGDQGTPDEIIKNTTECLEKVNQLNNFKPIDTSVYN